MEPDDTGDSSAYLLGAVVAVANAVLYLRLLPRHRRRSEPPGRDGAAPGPLGRRGPHRRDQR
ncbi:hypothetical protein AB0H57_23970 [Micromonospora sp. NPDC050686]|uniref:hypothetical protein n=1 Tax=Micromonospora sp. NPDC050686 TaxID=3154631 RepID=UPI0033CBAE09